MRNVSYKVSCLFEDQVRSFRGIFDEFSTSSSSHPPNGWKKERKGKKERKNDIIGSEVGA